MDGCGEQEFYLPPLDDILPHAQIDVVVRNAVRMPLGHLQVLLIRAGECAGVGFTDKRGRVSFTCVAGEEYVLRAQRRGKTAEKALHPSQDGTCELRL
jgi:hypothetical protein